MADVWVTIDGIARESDKAVLYETAEGEVWIPRSQIKDERTLRGRKGAIDEIQIPEWLAKEKGLV